MHVLILGATGYLGGNIVKNLREKNHQVTCVVRNISNTSRIETFGVDFISNDINSIELYLKHNPIDWIINGVCTYKRNDSLYADLLMSNTIFPLTVLNLAVKYGVKGFLTIGTSLPIEFNHYSFSKHELARFGRYLSENDGISFVELKLEMFYGGYAEPSGRFLSSVKNKLLNNQEVDLTEGYQKRDIIRVDDVVEIIRKIIENNYTKGYMSLPVGSGENHSIREIITFMKDEMGSFSKLNFGAIPTRSGEPDTLADIKWYRELGYELKYNFFEGLKDWVHL